MIALTYIILAIGCFAIGAICGMYIIFKKVFDTIEMCCEPDEDSK